MSAQNQISITIPDATITDILGQLNEIKTQLAPYLHALTPEDRHSLFKMGDKTLATVLKTKSYIETNPEFIPPYMDREEFVRDAVVVDQLLPVMNLAQQISRDLEDTIMCAGSDSIQSAMMYYGQVKEAATRGVASAHPIYEDLSQRFAKRSRKTTANQ